MRLHTLLSLTSFLSLFICCKSNPVEIVYEIESQDVPTELDKTKNYILKKKSINSDFDYSKLDDIDATYGLFFKPKKTISAFEPVSGKYIYYQFIATFRGSSYNDGAPTTIKDFHDILIIKTNEKNKIIDAYQYTLEWSEPPFQYDLWKTSVKNLKLKNNLLLEDLKLIRTYNWRNNKEFLKENGIIKIM